MSNSAIDTAARFGDIPFVEFTKDLVTGVFDSLVEAHVLQMEEYASFVNSLTQDLSTYINNTKDGVTFDQISEFLLKYELPEVDSAVITAALAKLEAPPANQAPAVAAPTSGQPATEATWWGGLINALAPVVTSLVDKLGENNSQPAYDAFATYNGQVIQGVQATIPNYTQIKESVAALIASNKYGLLQTMARQGMMRLVVTEGEIETKITFSTWNNSVSESQSSDSVEDKFKFRSKQVKGGGILGVFKSKKKYNESGRTITVNTAKSYQRDSSGTSVNIFGRVLIRFKTDYAPLNG